MAAIGVDTHKTTLAACAVDPLGSPIAEAIFANDLKGHPAFIAWARSLPEATIGIEGSSSYGAPLARAVQREARERDTPEVTPEVARHYLSNPSQLWNDTEPEGRRAIAEATVDRLRQ